MAKPSASAFRHVSRFRRLRIAATIVVLAAASAVLAQEAGAPKAGAPATEADYDTLRKLLGVQAPPTREAAPAAEPEPAPAPEPVPSVAAPEPEPEPEAPANGKGRTAAKKAPPKYKPKPRPVYVPKKAPQPQEAGKPAPAVEAPVEASAPAATFISPGVPPPGTVVEASNLDRWKDFISPSIAWAVRRGAKLNVVENQPVELEPARAEATQRYSAQVQLSPDKTYMQNYVAGIPFPFVQTDDPDAGIKMILNWDARIVLDDLDIRNFGCETGNFGAKTGMVVERDYITGHFRRLYYLSRLYHEPKPTWQNPENIRYREMLHPVLEPFDLKGAGFTYNRYQDPRRQDDSWLYFPQTKRVRRLSTAQRSEGVFGQDIDLDSYGGYAGNPSWTSWRLLGTKTIIASMHGRELPAPWMPPPNDFLHDDVWEPRDVWVLEGRSRLPGYAFGSRVIYIDRESFFIPYTEIFDLQGRLWKGLVQNWVYRDGMRPESKYKVGYNRIVLSNVEMFDMQAGHATRCQFPDESLKGQEDGWYLNTGSEEGTTENAFDVATFIGEGR
ncbi:MAG TPA: DUF1329 domain-containing protein [Candidatus Limnocylindrales bacterium]|nr:DUF1329 domain-containing protein [Candidatus Limnocylindrales bacterium]